MKLTWFQDLNDNSLVGLRVNAFVNFGILASSNLLDNLVVILSSSSAEYRVSD